VEYVVVAFRDMLYVALVIAVLLVDHELITELVVRLTYGADVTVAFRDEVVVALANAVVLNEMLAVALEIAVAFIYGAEVSVTLSEILAVALETDVALIGRLVIVTLAYGAFGRVELVELVELFGTISGNFGGRVLLHSVRLPMLFTPSKLNRMYA
jgi:hypothetical protein